MLAPFFLLLVSAMANDEIFSGPQPGEATTPFRVVEIAGPMAGQERDAITDHDGAPTALVFMHGIERSMMPLLRVIDEYGALRRDSLKTEIIFLATDRLEGEQRVKAAAGSLKPNARVGLSLDGIEGPGNYGLNKDCLMTIITTKANKVIANLALVQPGIADAPRVLEALAKACGDEQPPTAEELTRLHAARTGGGGRPAAMEPRPAANLENLELATDEGLRRAVHALITEVRTLRAEVDALRGGNPPAVRPNANKDPFPGAVPTDATLQGLLRRFIRPTNDDATVDAVMAEVRDHIKDDAALKQQAIDGWTRVLHFGDHYGTEYSRTVGKKLLEELTR